MKNKLITAAAILLCGALIIGISAVAAPSVGGENDPLITLSYLEKTFTDSIMGRVEDLIDDRVSELDEKYAEVSEGSDNFESAAYSVVTLQSGDKLVGTVGTELILRIGSAVCSAPASPGLIDLTTGSILENGSSLLENHHYIVSIDGRAIKATAYTMIVVRGDYSIE